MTVGEESDSHPCAEGAFAIGLILALGGIGTIAVQALMFIFRGEWTAWSAKQGLLWVSPSAWNWTQTTVPGLAWMLDSAPQAALLFGVGFVLLMCGAIATENG